MGFRMGRFQILSSSFSFTSFLSVEIRDHNINHLTFASRLDNPCERPIPQPWWHPCFDCSYSIWPAPLIVAPSAPQPTIKPFLFDFNSIIIIYAKRVNDLENKPQPNCCCSVGKYPNPLAVGHIFYDYIRCTAISSIFIIMVCVCTLCLLNYKPQSMRKNALTDGSAVDAQHSLCIDVPWISLNCFAGCRSMSPFKFVHFNLWGRRVGRLMTK